MQKTSPLLSSIVVCRNHQGAEITANILRLRRYSVAFEVYNPYSVLQLSEVLNDFRIRVGDQIRIRQDPFEYQVAVTGLAEKRVGAKVAATLFEESATSRAAREDLAFRLKHAEPELFQTKGRPTKKQRRDIRRWKER